MRITKNIFIFSLIVVLATWVIYTFWQAYQPKPIILQGQIEAQQYSVSSKIGGRIDEVLVHKGDQLKKEQLVFTFKSPELEAKLAQAKAGQMAANAIADKAIVGARIEQIQAAKDLWQQAQVQVNFLHKSYTRIDALFKEGVTAEQQKDEIYAKLQAAKFARDAAFQMYSMAKDGARKEDQEAAAGKAQMADSMVQEVEVYTADTKVFSPHAGEVTTVLLHSGELAPQGFPVVSIMDMDDAWANFNVREDILYKFPKGHKFTARIPALQNSYEFEVRYVAVLGDFATWRTTNSETGFDMRTFAVEARPSKTIPGLRAGMSVIIEL
ncbi:MAG: efflux RND transporter periplasmic adaptor subunit [Desulfotalea sp.]